MQNASKQVRTETIDLEFMLATVRKRITQALDDGEFDLEVESRHTIKHQGVSLSLE